MAGTHIRGFRRAGPVKMLNYDPNRYPSDPNHHTPHNHQDTPAMKTASKPKKTAKKFAPHNPRTLVLPDGVDNAMRAAGIMIRLPDNRILVGRRSPDAKTYPKHLQIPGGKVEPHESARDGAVRELLEETGLRIDTRLLVPLDFDPELRNAADELYHAFVFLLDVKAPPVGIQNLEGEKYGPWQWMSMGDVLDDVAIPGLVRAIKYLAVKAGTEVKPVVKKAIAKKAKATQVKKAKALIKAAKAKHPALKKVMKAAKKKLDAVPMAAKRGRK